MLAFAIFATSLVVAFNGGSTKGTAVLLPIAVPGTFTGDNTGLSSPPSGGVQEWNNVTWWKWTPATTITIGIRATAVAPAGWDNTLEVWSGVGAATLVTENDDSFGLDSQVTFTATAGETYVIGLGAFNSLSTGTATLRFFEAPPAPTAVSATSGNASALVTWSMADADGESVTSYQIFRYIGGVQSGSAVIVSGFPPATSSTVTGLVNGTAYTFRVAAANIVGTGALSIASSPVTPVGPAGAPTAVSATAGDATATVSFVAPAMDGGTPITSYAVTSSPGGLTTSGAASPLVVAGLTNGTAYTFTVRATTSFGLGVVSAASSAVTPLGPAGAPTAVSATAGDATATVSFVPPAITGGAPITSYTVTSSPDGLTASGAGSPLVVAGLTNGTPYTFTVRATTSFGLGATSAASLPVTPLGPPSAELDITKSGPATITAGSNVSYIVTVTNGGPDAADSVALTDALPPGTTFVSATQTSGPAFSCANPSVGGTGVVSCTIPALAAAASASFTLVFTTDASLFSGAVLSNTASVASTTADPTSVNNAATTSATVGTRLYTLAEGTSGDFFDTYVLVANPGAIGAPVKLTFFNEDGETASVAAVVPAHGRFTQKVDDLPGVANGGFATTVASLSGAPLLVERATYFAGDYRAGHAATSRGLPRTTWYFAEGTEGDFFDTYLLISNAGATPADITVTFFLEDGLPVTRTYSAAAFSRLSIVAALVPELVDHSFAMRVTSTVPVAAERSVYFGDGYVGGHSEVGVAAPSTTWLFAEGATGPGFDTFVLLANPGTTAASATITYRTGTGAVVTRTHVVPAEGRATVAVEGEDPALADAEFWIEVQADLPLVVERAMYWLAGGAATWTEGHVSAGATAPADRWGFAEGIVGGGMDFKTFFLLANPGATDATVEVQYLPTSGAPITQTYTVPAGGRTTISVESAVPALRDVPFGAIVTATSPGLIVAERSIYWTHNGPYFVGGSNALGVTPF